MIKTRFDETERWVTGYGEIKDIEDMDTDHIINTLKMFMNKPLFVQSMIIKDIECKAKMIWNSSKDDSALTNSLNNITSMTLDQTRDYVIATPLCLSMRDELVKRGVNTNQLLKNIIESAKVQIKDKEEH